MAWRLIGTKPFSEPMLPYYQLDTKEHISVKFYLKFKSFQSWKRVENVVGEMATICLGLDVLIIMTSVGMCDKASAKCNFT